MAVGVRVAVLGPLEVTVGGVVVPLAGDRLRAALCRLAVAVPRSVSVDELVDAIWPDTPPAAASHALQSLLSRLRAALGGAGSVLMDAHGYRLPLDRDAVDVLEFRDLVADGRRAALAGDDEGALDAFGRALALWRGPALGGVPDAAHLPGLTAELERLRLDAAAGRFAAALALGRAGEVAGDLRTAVDEHPLREDFAAQLITALAATGRGGEALAAYERIRRDLAGQLGADPGPELRDLHLRLLGGDLGRPVHPRRGRKRPLGTPLTSFVGRDAEVAAVLSSVAAHRLSTLVGPGGAGKTRLATEVARTWSADGHREAWVVELAPVTSGTGVPRAVLDALGLLETRLGAGPGGDDRERLLDALGEADGLLVVDNCEHVVDAVAGLVAEVVAAAPGVRVLATSREPLGLTGEALTAVEPLALPPAGAGPGEAARSPAVRLFLDRAATARPGFVLDHSTAGDVVTVVRRLDGLPLAIELAVARLRVLPVAEIARRLSDRFRLLTGGDRTALPRHRTLRAVVGWSWDLLTGRERLLAERLSVFPGGATEEAAVAVCADDALPADEIGDLLVALAEKSLLTIQPDTPIRCRMLETLREYGLDRLTEQGLADSWRERHAGHFAGLTDALEPVLRGHDQLPALATLRAEEANIAAARRFLLDSGRPRAALMSTLSTAWLTRMTGNAHDIGWLDRLIDAHRGIDEPHLVHAEAVRAMALLEEGRVAGAGAELHRRWRAAPAPYGGIAAMAELFPGMAGLAADGPVPPPSDPWLRAVVHAAAAGRAENGGDPDRMRAEVALAARGFREAGDRWGIAITTSLQAQLKAVDGDLPGALADCGVALRAARELGASYDARFLRLRTAWLRWSSGDNGAAREDLAALRPAGGSWRSVETGLLADAMTTGVDWVDGDHEGALRLADDVRTRLTAARRTTAVRGHVVTTVLASTAVVNALAAAGDPRRLDQALADLREAYPVATATGDRPVLALLGAALAQVAAHRGDPGAAAEVLGAAARLRGGGGGGGVFVARLTERLRAELGEEFDRRYRAGRDGDAVARLDPGRHDGGA
ncbi:BTAD domain-containing putative transcriptional regulator, partial [Lentzea sp. NPDC060358]|uniref:BTAD domain-containing putative transcriptional regulator n=1 Tax=Lentzea sp. NPDC060358 TaxID=3347103 RepID=UPI00365C47FE